MIATELEQSRNRFGNNFDIGFVQMEFGAVIVSCVAIVGNALPLPGWIAQYMHADKVAYDLFCYSIEFTYRFYSCFIFFHWIRK